MSILQQVWRIDGIEGGMDGTVGIGNCAGKISCRLKVEPQNGVINFGFPNNFAIKRVKSQFVEN